MKSATLRRMRTVLFLALLLIPLTGAAQTLIRNPGPVSCADHSIVARAVRTTSDVKAFVRCAQEFVQEAGTAEAYRAFHEDERWRSSEIYISVIELIPSAAEARVLVHPTHPHAEGAPWGTNADRFGDDLVREAVRVVQTNGSGWTYYAFPNPATGNTELKASFLLPVDWNGIPAMVVAGVHLRDLPGSCHGGDVNASLLDAEPSEQRLQEFVRCAAMELDSNGYFASVSLANNSRWRSGSIYLFGLDTYGYSLFSGSPANPLIGSELSSDFIGSFGGRNVLGVADAFGETFLYYSNRNPATNQWQRKVTFVKRVTSFGVPVLIGAGYYLD